MRNGCGKIFTKGTLKPIDPSLHEITNKPFLRQQQPNEKS
jgi:hypothetical protein